MSGRRCMVNIYLAEDKHFRVHSDRIRKFFIFVPCFTQNKRNKEGLTHFRIRRSHYDYIQ